MTFYASYIVEGVACRLSAISRQLSAKKGERHMLTAQLHPTEIELADFLENRLSNKERERFEDHAASCEECLVKIVSAYESVREFEKDGNNRKGKKNIMKKMNLYLILAVLSFLLSFAIPKYFAQFLLATLLLGIKWISDAKSTRMLVMIYEAWKKGGEKEASRILETLSKNTDKRF